MDKEEWGRAVVVSFFGRPDLTQRKSPNTKSPNPGTRLLPGLDQAQLGLEG